MPHLWQAAVANYLMTDAEDKKGVLMADELSALLDAFAELRRTWDELVGLQPDIISAGGPLSDEDLARLNERVSAHLVTAVALEDQIEIMRAEKGGA